MSIGVADRAAMVELVGHLDRLGEKHAGMHDIRVGWMLPGLSDPDGHEVRFYTHEVADPGLPDRYRVHDPGPAMRIEPL